MCERGCKVLCIGLQYSSMWIIMTRGLTNVEVCQFPFHTEFRYYGQVIRFPIIRPDVIYMIYITVRALVRLEKKACI